MDSDIGYCTNVEFFCCLQLLVQCLRLFVHNTTGEENRRGETSGPGPWEGVHRLCKSSTRVSRKNHRAGGGGRRGLRGWGALWWEGVGGRGGVWRGLGVGGWCVEGGRIQKSMCARAGGRPEEGVGTGIRRGDGATKASALGIAAITGLLGTWRGELTGIDGAATALGTGGTGGTATALGAGGTTGIATALRTGGAGGTCGGKVGVPVVTTRDAGSGPQCLFA